MNLPSSCLRLVIAPGLGIPAYVGGSLVDMLKLQGTARMYKPREENVSHTIVI